MPSDLPCAPGDQRRNDSNEPGYYGGSISNWCAPSKQHTIQFDDGNTKVVDLVNCASWRFLVKGADSDWESNGLSSSSSSSLGDGSGSN